MPSRLRRHDEWGHVHFVTLSCFRRLPFLRHSGVRDALIKCMCEVRDTRGLRWLGYVVMPEHVHLLLLPQAVGATAPVPISAVLHDLKGAAGRLGKAALRDVWREHRTLGLPSLDRWAVSDGPKPFWKPRGCDLNVVRDGMIIEKLAYMHANPVRRGLVSRPDEWRWSSYRYYECGDPEPMAMDWDGGLPLKL